MLHVREGVEDLARVVVRTDVKGTVKEHAKERAKRDAKILQNVEPRQEVVTMAVAALMVEIMAEEHLYALDAQLLVLQVVVVPVLAVVMVNAVLHVEALVEQAV